MDDVPIPGHDDRRLFKQFLAQQGVPAYIRRAQQVEAAYDQLAARCRNQRDEWLTMVRIRLGILEALAVNWDVLQPLLADNDQITTLTELHGMVGPRLRHKPPATSSLRKLRRALADLTESLERFNRRWQAYLAGLDLTSINALRDAYNRYYVLEKECALRSARVARQGFRPLPPVTVADLSALLPLLPVPRCTV